MALYSHLPPEVIRRAALELPELTALVFEPHPPNPDLTPEEAAAVKATLTRFALFLVMRRLETLGALLDTAESELHARERDCAVLHDILYGRGH
ncbi:hypothetical protein CN072_27365 [Sinorhizobium meliloti]|uniref:hypothetical protein n=1 Tax=Rhizobium meliloti TaxID=382 RepID=UPI000FD21270|nr:hypothetical protein [Sinorhizobium meliloti]RVP80660.1 hypothetical protein CN072_27365 [Sinorhizobium meliloti]